MLSWADEAAAVEAEGRGLWSNTVSQLARKLGLVTFDVKGVYAGYSSQEPSFPDNAVVVDEKRWAAWLADEPLAKERAILAKLVDDTPSEFFHHPTLFDEHKRFDSSGSATGPASRMALPAIRRGLLELLAGLPTGVWLSTDGLLELVRARAPTLILDPATRRPLERWEAERKKVKPGQLEELYTNFRERAGDDYWHPTQLTTQLPDGFARVEGRYLQFFLEEVPWLCGFVGLALSRRQRKPGDVNPALDEVLAFSVSPRLAQVLRGEPALSKVSVKVLATFEVIVEAASYPDRELALLAPSCVALKEDGPTHHLRLDRGRVLALAASQAGAAGVKPLLERLNGRPLPPNVAAELDAWCGHAEKLTVFESVALVELTGPGGLARELEGELGGLVLDAGCSGFLVARDPSRVISVLEQRLRAPVVVTHRAEAFAATAGRLAAPAPAKAATAPVGAPACHHRPERDPLPPESPGTRVPGKARSEDLHLLIR